MAVITETEKHLCALVDVLVAHTPTGNTAPAQQDQAKRVVDQTQKQIIETLTNEKLETSEVDGVFLHITNRHDQLKANFDQDLLLKTRDAELTTNYFLPRPWRNLEELMKESFASNPELKNTMSYAIMRKAERQLDQK